MGMLSVKRFVDLAEMQVEALSVFGQFIARFFAGDSLMNE